MGSSIWKKNHIVAWYAFKGLPDTRCALKTGAVCISSNGVYIPQSVRVDFGTEIKWHTYTTSYLV